MPNAIGSSPITPPAVAALDRPGSARGPITLDTLINGAGLRLQLPSRAGLVLEGLANVAGGRAPAPNDWAVTAQRLRASREELPAADPSRSRLRQLPSVQLPPLPISLTSPHGDYRELASAPDLSAARAGVGPLRGNGIFEMRPHPGTCTMGEVVRFLNTVWSLGFLMHVAQAAGGAARPLHEAVAAWHGGGGDAAAVTQRWTAFDGEVGAAQFGTFLDRLGRTVNATGPASTPAFRAAIAEWLSRMADQPALREATFAIVAPGNERCEDRATLMFLLMTRLRVDYDVASGHYDAQPAALLQAIQGTRRLEALERIALEKIDPDRTGSMGEYDDVEVLLAFPIGLREQLSLPIGVKAMRFGGVSDVTAHDLAQAEVRVRALDDTFPQYLATHASFHQVLERWAPDRFAAAKSHLDAAVADGPYAMRVERRIEAAGLGLSDDPAAISQAGKAVLEEMQVEAFGPLVQAYLHASKT